MLHLGFFFPLIYGGYFFCCIKFLNFQLFLELNLDLVFIRLEEEGGSLPFPMYLSRAKTNIQDGQILQNEPREKTSLHSIFD